MYDSPTVAAGRVVVVITGGVGAEIVMERAWVAVETWTVKLLVPAVEGVPEMMPLFRLSPGGSDPAVIDHVYGGVPPEAESVAE